VNAARIHSTPVLQIVNEADDAVPATHNPAIRNALATTDKEYIEIQGATHYYLGQPAELAQCIGAVVSWSRRKALLD
jgi:dienelactone hydrolase